MLRLLQTARKLTGDSLKELSGNDPMRLAGATAFFTTFALPSILIIILQITRLVINPMQGSIELFDKLSRYVGKQSAKQLLLTLESFQDIARNWMITVGGFIFLLFVATTLFQVIKNSLNEIWNIGVSRSESLLKFRSRLRALVVILFAGVLFLLVIVVEGVQAFITDDFQNSSPFFRIILGKVISNLISVLVATTWFTLIFCYLPDGRPSLKVGFFGALVTGVLFTIGKIIVRWALFHSNLPSIFGASASFVLLLLFVFYSSLIFYFGAAFTKTLAEYLNQPISPLSYAVKVHLEEEDS